MLALQVLVAARGITMYQHYCHLRGELLAVSIALPEEHSCTVHQHAKHEEEGSKACHQEDRCYLVCQFYKAATVSIAESCKPSASTWKNTSAEAFSLLFAFFKQSAISLSLANFYFPPSPTGLTGRKLLHFIQQFRL
ncbi:MAG: hypothetical protein RMJ44_10145 [Cytophagales bacterium]|nr:hypothetical protein [Bernardetiaceae bacterium]MDW8211437.1 hypothetical protein [Cytophagales bacterium]